MVTQHFSSGGGFLLPQDNSPSDEQWAGNFKKRVGYAYRVLRVLKGSPLAKQGLVPWFDFIVRAGPVDLVSEDLADWKEPAFADVIKFHEEKSLRLTIFNCKSRTLRHIVFTPRRGWGKTKKKNGEDAVTDHGLTGLSVSYDYFTDALQKLVHVVDVLPNSPAHAAGLQSMSDYLLGTMNGLPFRNSAELISCVREHVDQPLYVFVYSSIGDTVRIAKIVPSHNWSGDGLLGCDIGIGQSHNIPSDCQTTIGAFRRPLSSLWRSGNDAADLGQSEDLSLSMRPTSSRKFELDVKTTLGYGQILGEHSDGAAIIELDWKLPNGATVISYCNSQNYIKLPSLKKASLSPSSEPPSSSSNL